MIKQGRNESGKFTSKSEDIRQVRSIRLTDSTWDTLGKLADQRSITRADLIEEWINQEYFNLLNRVQELETELYNLKNNSIQLSESILQVINNLSSERSITPEELINQLLQFPTCNIFKTEPSVTQLEIIDTSSSSTENSQLSPLNQNQLAKRFNYNSSNLAKQRNKGYESFVIFSASKDPDGISWQYSKQDKLYYPIVNS